MSAYVIANLIVRDWTTYRRYELAFKDVLARTSGKLLSVCDRPEPVEGRWPYTRTVLLWFPSKEAARELYASAEYRAILPYRWRSTYSEVVLLEAFEH